jgi:hypothetical protein
MLLDPGEQLAIASTATLTGTRGWLLPDSEVVYSPGAMDFDVMEFVAAQGGYLNDYRERVGGEWMYGPQVVLRAAQDHSINPRLLLAILETRSGWLIDPQVPQGAALTYPIWRLDTRLQGLYLQLSWAANELSHGYYGWRQGDLLNLPLADGSTLPLPPDLNAATAAVDYLATRWTTRSHADPAPIAAELMRVYSRLFGDPWSYALPIYEAGVSQPHLGMPFPAENPWVFTGGPHGSWSTDSAWGALDFAPKWDRRRRTSEKEVTALADSIVARVEQGVVVLDLDGDGYEQTGWSVLYLHVVPIDGIVVGTALAEGDLIGMAAEEGGVSNGLHLHLARKYNGEWVAADGPLPLDLDGWHARAGPESYLGVLYRDGVELLACPYDSRVLLGTGGGSMLSNSPPPSNLRGCWAAPGGPDLLAAAPTDQESAAELIDPQLSALESGLFGLPPTLLLSVPD